MQTMSTLYRLLLFLLFLSFHEFVKGQYPFRIEGKIKIPGKARVDLFYLDKVDSVITETGDFKFVGIIQHPVHFNLAVTDLQTKKFKTRSIFVESGTVNITTSFEDLPDARITMLHSEHQKILDTYNSKFKHLTQMHWFVVDSILRRMPLTTKDTLTFENLLAKINAFQNLYEKDFISNNLNNYVSAYFFYRYAINALEPSEAIRIANSFKPPVSNSFYIKEAKEKLRYASLIKVGTPVSAIYLEDTAFKKIKLDSFLTGKLNIVDLWASWCIPCQEVNKRLRLLHDKYSHLGLKIISVSLDDNKRDWLQAVKADTPQWFHFRDKKGSKGEINRLYNIVAGSGIPYILAIGADKKYLALDVDIDEIESLIEEHLNN